MDQRKPNLPDKGDARGARGDGALEPGRGSVAAGVEAFLRDVAAMPVAGRAAGGRGRLLFCLDATASREPTWDQACSIQGEMFAAADSLGGLDVQLAFYRGFHEFKVAKWTADGLEMARLMGKVRCLAGRTQVGRLLAYAAEETRRRRIDAAVFVGDAFEEEPDLVGHAAGTLGLLGVPVFIFHEGRNPAAERMFRQIATLTKGAYVRFDLSSPDALKRLLGAVAAYAAAGRAALLEYGRRKGGEALLLTRQMG